MANSLLPKGMKIRVLTTIEDGETHQEALHENHMVGMLPDFVRAAHENKLLISRKAFDESLTHALSQAIDARELLVALDSVKATEKERRQLWQIIELVSEAISSLKDINTRE